MSKMRSDLSDRNIKQCCWSEQALLAYVSYWVQVVKVQWTQHICSEKIIIVATDRENKKNCLSCCRWKQNIVVQLLDLKSGSCVTEISGRPLVFEKDSIVQFITQTDIRSSAEERTWLYVTFTSFFIVKISFTKLLFLPSFYLTSTIMFILFCLDTCHISEHKWIKTLGSQVLVNSGFCTFAT